jgi:nitroreductase
MGIIRSQPQVEYADSYHITDTFSNHTEWKHTVSRMTHRNGYPFFYEQANATERFGSQPYVIYAIYDQETKEDIQAAAYGQPHLSACTCIFVFCARTNFKLDVLEPSRFPYYLWENSKPLAWATRQTYMALGFVIAACAEESVPCYPVDTFSSAALASLLELPSHLIPTALLALGASD